MLEHRFVPGPGVVGSIARHLGNRTGNLFQQRGERLAIVSPAPGEFYRHDLFRCLLTPQVPRALRAPTTHAVLVDLPLRGPVNFQPGRINHEMARTVP